MDEKINEIRCPNCNHLIATIPPGRELEDPLVCPGCGETIKIEPDSAIGKLIAKVKDTFSDGGGGGLGKA